MSYVSPMGAYINTGYNLDSISYIENIMMMMRTSCGVSGIQDSSNSFEEDEISLAISDWDTAISETSDSVLASTARSVAMSRGGYNSTGRCLGGVNQALRQTYGEEYGIWKNSAYQALPVLRSEPFTSKFREVDVSRDELPNLPAGSIVVWDRSEGHPHGHISIALGNGQEASDYIGTQMTKRDAEYYVFIPV